MAMAESTNNQVADWQNALLKTAADFGAVAAENLRKQTDKDAQQKRLESPNSPDWKKWGLILAGVVVAVVVLRKLKLF